MEAKEFRRGETKGKRKGSTFTNVQQIDAVPHLTMNAMKMVQTNRYFVL